MTISDHYRFSTTSSWVSNQPFFLFCQTVKTRPIRNPWVPLNRFSGHVSSIPLARPLLHAALRNRRVGDENIKDLHLSSKVARKVGPARVTDVKEQDHMGSGHRYSWISPHRDSYPVVI